METKTSTPLETFVDGLDASGDGRGYGPEHEAARHLLEAAPEMLDALKYAAEIIKTARQYFPKSIKNRDTFALENTNAAIGKAIHKAEGRI